ncbi:hypothetical protein GM708_07615 [Vibrio cholerae]|nr:hypothetical protein [Vibrio cholerae]
MEPDTAPRVLDEIERAHLKAADDVSHVMFRYPAPAAIASLVQRFWIPVWSVPAGEQSVQRVMQYPVSLLVIAPDYARFYGVATGLSQTVLTGKGWAAGVMCTAAAGSLIARGPMARFTDRHVDVSDVLGRSGEELTDRVRAAMSEDPQLPGAHRAVMDAFGDALRPLLPVDPEGELIERIVALVEARTDLVTVAQLCAVAAVAVAKTSVRRFEQRLDRLEHQGASDAKMARTMGNYFQACERLGEREQHAIPDIGRAGAKLPESALDSAGGHEPTEHQALPAPRPSAADSLTAESIRELSWDEVSDLYERHADDPEAMERLEELVDAREAEEGGEDNDSSAWQEAEPPYGEGDHVSNPTLRATRKLTPHEVAREEYDSYVYSQISKCESELSFHLNEKGRAAGISMDSLFTGPVSRVKKYGSEELNAWFAVNGRQSLASFRYGMFGWDSDFKASYRNRT